MFPSIMFWGLLNKSMFAFKTPFVFKIEGNFKNCPATHPSPPRFAIPWKDLSWETVEQMTMQWSVTPWFPPTDQSIV